MADPNIHTADDFAHAYSGRDWRHYRWLVAVCVEHGEPGLIVDFGAGLGFFVEACARFGLTAVGSKRLGHAVEGAKKRYRIDIRHHYLSHPLRFEEGGVSSVVMNQTIEHLPPGIAQQALVESFRILRRGGLLAIYPPCRFDPTQGSEPTAINLYSSRRLREEVVPAGSTNYRATDSARLIFAGSRILRLEASTAFRMSRSDFLSSTADCLAYGP